MKRRVLRHRYGRAASRHPSVAIAQRAASVKELLTKPPPPDGAFIGGPWGYGLSGIEADRRIRKWRNLLTIHGLTIHEIANDMATWRTK